MAQERIPTEVSSQVFTIEQLATRYNQSPYLISKMLDAGWLPYINYSQKTRIIPIKAIEAFEDELGRAAAQKLIKEDKAP